MLQAAERPRARASRVKGINRAFVTYLMRVVIKVDRMLEVRAATDTERRILGELLVALSAAIRELNTLPLPADPREWRRVKKRNG